MFGVCGDGNSRPCLYGGGVWGSLRWCGQARSHHARRGGEEIFKEVGTSGSRFRLGSGPCWGVDAKGWLCYGRDGVGVVCSRGIFGSRGVVGVICIYTGGWSVVSGAVEADQAMLCQVELGVCGDGSYLCAFAEGVNLEISRNVGVGWVMFMNEDQGSARKVGVDCICIGGLASPGGQAKLCHTGGYWGGREWAMSG